MNWPRMKILVCLLPTTYHFHVLYRSFSNKFSMSWRWICSSKAAGGLPPLEPLPPPLKQNLDPLPAPARSLPALA